ncbi:putative RNA-directed DNA polymerase [Tanacetum coccineum]
MELVLHNVKHVLDMRLNIISTGLLDEDGYHNSSGNGLWKVTLESKLYMTHMKISKSIINAIDNDDMTELWHKRLGHMSEKGMSILSKKNVLSGAHDINLKKCSHCLARKQTRLAFVTKDQVLDVFKQFHALVERQTGKKLKCIRTDNGGEYIVPFDAYCREHGIQYQKTPPKIPQLNGLAEWMNRTLVERVRCLLSHAGLPASFWGEALNMAVHAFVHIPKDKRSKLDVKSKPCMFLGYGQDEFGYMLYDPVQKRLVRSRDVVFEEDQTLKDIENAERETIPQHNDDLIDLDPGADDVDAHEQPNLDEDVHPDDMPPFLLLRRSTRDHHPSIRYSVHEYVLLTDGGEPECYAETMEDEHKKEWFKAVEDEMNSLHENNTFELVKLPKGKRALKNKWVYKLKTEEHTSRPRYKARLVVKGFSHKRGIDFDEIFSPFVKMGSIRVVLSLAASLDLEVEQMDVKTAFLHGDQDKEIYMEQPEGFQVKGKEDYKFGDDDFIILLLYVNDMLIVGKNIGRIAQLKRDLSKSFSMKDLGPTKQIIDIRIFYDRGAKKLHISCRFNMDKAKVVSSPLTTNFKLTNKDCPSSKKNIEKMDRVSYTSAVGSLMYAMVCTRPDLAHAIGVVSRFLSNPDSEMCVALSTTEAEYMAATEACKELLWLKRFLQELGFKQQRYAVLCDNQSAIHLAKNSMFHKRTKHIDICYHFIRDAIEDGMFELNKVHTDDNASDMLTKVVAREKLKVNCSITGMANSSS